MVSGDATSHRATTTVIHARYSTPPTHELVLVPSVMWLTFCTKPVMNTISVHGDEEHERRQDEEVDTAGDLVVERSDSGAEPGRNRGRLQQACDERQRRCH